MAMLDLVAYELFAQVLNGQKTSDEVIEFITQESSSATNAECFMDYIVDSLVQCDMEIRCLDDTGKQEEFVKLVKALIQKKLVTEDILKERFEIDTNFSIGLTTDKKIAQTSYNRLRTKLYYKQNKFNLMREENEGFARLITQLCDVSETKFDVIIKNIVQTVGKYQVDPNRTLDLLLEAFENDTHDKLFLKLTRAFLDSPEKIKQIIVLKLGFYSNTKEKLLNIPQSFYRLLAILMQEGVLDLDDIYPYLLPSDDKILEYHKKLLEEAKFESRRYSLAIIGGGDDRHFESVFEKLSDEEKHYFVLDNQKLNLCAHLIQLGDWDRALWLTKKLPEYYCFSNSRIARAACDLIAYMIDPIYLKYCGLPTVIKQKIPHLVRKTDPPEQITQSSQLQAKLLPLLQAVGPFVSANTLLLTKLIRLFKGVMYEKDESNEDLTIKQTRLYYDLLDVINECILPAVTLSAANCCLSRELWGLLKNLNYHTRYKLYNSWRDEGLNQHLLRAKGHVLLAAKHHMKRLSKETIRSTGRHLGKLCYSTPVITLGYVLLQVQSYDNLITLLIDAFKYLPSLALDVLLWSIIEALADPNRMRQSTDGMAVAAWLTNLSTFSANFILKYKVEFTSFLQFIANQLKAGKSLDLVLLADLVQKMTGIESTQDITEEKIEALLGGEVLRTEGAYFSVGKNTRKTAARLKDALIESRLAMPLCILMAQLRDCLFFSHENESHLKLVGKLYDQCQETFVQYGVFLSLNLSIDDYMNFLPTIDLLMNEHKLYPDAAFFLARPMIMHRIRSKFEDLRNQATTKKKESSDDGNSLMQADEENLFIQAANEVINPLVANLEPTIKANYGYQFSTKLFVLFWTFSMNDLEVPSNCYEREVQRLRTSLSENDDDPKKRKENERLSNLIFKLKVEESTQNEYCRNVSAYLNSEKKNIFPEKVACNPELIHQFIQHCLFARSILTAYDAYYSAKFILTLHELKTEGFSTLICYDRLLCDITYMMGACTENEANHYGRFLCNLLKTITHWHSDKTIYDQRCGCYPGFVFRVSEEMDPKANLDYENFRHVCHKWHYRLTKALVLSLESNSYVQIRNALIVLIAIIDYFPVISSFGKAIERRVEEVRVEEKSNRQDLYALATAYFGRLETKKSSFIHENEFHKVEEPASESSKSTSNGGSSGSGNKETKKLARPSSNHDSGHHHRSSSKQRKVAH